MTNIISFYILRRFFNLLFFIMLAGIAIFLCVDLVGHLDKFIDRQVGWGFIGKYYLYFVPYIIYLILPVTVLLTTLFSLGSMTTANEITALKASGFSVYRILYIVGVPALLLSLFTLTFGESVVPYFNKKRMDIYRTEVEKVPKTSTTRRGRIYLTEGSKRLININHFNAEKLSGFGINVQDVENNKLLYRMDAARMRYQKDHWIFSDVVIRDFRGDSLKVQKMGVYEWRELQFKPDDLMKFQAEPEEMNYNELKEFVNRLVETGASATRWRVDLENKLATPFAAFIIVIFGVPIAVTKRRSGLMVGFGISLLVAFLYFGIDKAIQVLGYKEIVPPFPAAWGSNILFMIVGIIAVIRVRK